MAVTPKVLLKRSSIAGKVPLVGDLQHGEIAINFEDGKLYYKDASNTIRAFIDSARVQAIADAIETTALAQLDSGEIITLIDSAYVQARQDYAYSSLTGVPTTVSTFTNDANYLDSATVQNVIDATYIQANQTTYDFLDSAEVVALIDSAYVQARQITYDFLDSAEAINLIDSSYVQARQDYAYASLTGAPTNVSQFANDAGYLTAATTVDSAEVQSIIDSDFAQRTTDELAEGSSNLYYTTARADSDFDIRLITKTTTDIAEGDNLYYTTARADSDFDSRLSGKSTDDLSEGLNQYYTTVRHNTDTLLQVDSAYVQLRQDYAYASLTGVPTNVSQFANDAGYLTAANTLDSAEASAIILEDVDSAYVQARQITYDFLDSAEVIALIDSTYVQARQITYDFLDSAEAINLIDSSYVQLRQDYAYASLTGAPTNVSAFTNDANYLDSNTSQAVINTNFAAKTTDDLTEGSTNQYYLKARVDSDIAASLNDSGNTVTVTINNTIEDKVDSAYVLDRVAEAPFLDSADAINLIDSAYVQLRQDYAYSSLTGKPNQGLNTTDSVTFSGLTISGNLTVSGTQSVINTEVFKVIDPLIHLGDSNINSDIVDIGFIGKYYADGQERHTGLVRDANNGEYYLYTNSVDSASDSVNQINLSAPGFTLATLNTGNITGQYQGFDSDFGTKTTSNLTEGSNLYYTDARVTAHVDAAYVQALQTPQDFAYASLTGAPTNVSQFANDAGYLTLATAGGLDSADVSAIIINDVDSAYVQLRQITYNTSDFVDSAYVSTQIGNIYIPSLGNDYLDSNTVTGVIDATYIQSNQTPQDFAYGSLTGVPTTVSTFTNDANYLDSNTVTGVIDAAYVQANQTAQDFSYASLTGKPNILDSADVSSIITADVDATFVQALQDYAYSSLTGTPNVLDSSHVIAIHNSLGGVDSAAIINLID
jgi:hypothetical protein